MTVIPIQKVDFNLFAKKSLQGRYCLSPFVEIEVTTSGRVRMCGCKAWMPRTVGDLTTHSLEEILASEWAQRIRQSIIDGTYQYCNENTCGILQNNRLNEYDTVPSDVKPLLADASRFNLPHWITIQGDNTCNLSCPSCRTQVIKPSPDQVAQRERLGRIIVDNLLPKASDQKFVIHVSTSGEVFASDLLLNLLSGIDLDRLPNFELCLQTNALLATKKWHRIQHLERALNFVMVSIDAATAQTYETVRRGGTWQQLVTSMEFLAEKKQQFGFELRTRMVVQNQNFQEILQFYEFSQGFDVDRVEYSQLTDWNTWSKEEFRKHNVLDPAHINYQQATRELEKVRNLPGVWCY